MESVGLLYEFREWVRNQEAFDVILYPDAGARMRYTACSIPHVNVEKERTADGIKINLPELPKTGKILVVDDICDGGATFIKLAEEVRKVSDADLYLQVTHGIFSKGFDIFKPYYKQIFTTNSYQDIGDSYFDGFKNIPTNVKQFKVI